jgi:two-component system, OmpR family, phosphate regulon sensor histidine kinase PhoR
VSALAWILAIVAGILALRLAYHVLHLSSFRAWLRRPALESLPRGRGVWEEAFAELHRFLKRRDAEQDALAETLARFRAAVRALPDGVVILDREHRIEWANPTATEHFGVDARRDFGQPAVNLIRHPDFVAYLADGDFGRPILLRAAQDRMLSVQVIEFGDDQKLLNSRDVTADERMHNMQRDFVANVSHELKTPVTVISGFVETLADESFELTSAQRSRYLAMMKEQAARMQRLVEDLLTLSALESGGAPAGEQTTEVASFIDRLAEEARALSAGRHRVEVTIEHGAGLFGSATELHSAFSNLVSNAVRYTPPGGQVRLAWRLADGRGIFSVSDSGIGIERRHIARLTERFYRVDNSRSRETGGTGLGLAIVKHVLTRHQASLEVTSEPGRGSTFSAVFPTTRVLPPGQKKEAA